MSVDFLGYNLLVKNKTPLSEQALKLPNSDGGVFSCSFNISTSQLVNIFLTAAMRLLSVSFALPGGLYFADNRGNPKPHV